MEKACSAFALPTPEEARSHMELEMIRDFGSFAYGHPLYAWDDGKRMLARCRTCGGTVLIQKSEFHSFSDFSDDGYYTDYFPVKGLADAERWNRRCDGFALESKFPSRYLCVTNGRLHWANSGGNEKRWILKRLVNASWPLGKKRA